MNKDITELKTWRQRLNVTYTEVGRRSRLHQSTIWNALNGKKSVTHENFLKIKDALQNIEDEQSTTTAA